MGDLDMAWVRTQYADRDAVLRTAHAALDRAPHPDTGIYGLVAALVIELEAEEQTDDS
jgi:hypothetical protein